MTRFNIRNAYFYKKIHTKSYKAKDNTDINEVLSTNVRQKFLDYFIKENDHKYVRSSPVMPFCDPTVAFVNAGMNQFKSIFLGQQDPLYTKVANTQKCVRVGGKHNDLNIVGSDGHHHTFFEMLGNWSFGNYFKKEACELSWNLLTGPYGLNPNSLYVTYFAGNKHLNLEPDLECKDIWRSLGIPDDHILPFSSENFWEMGTVGPCGPCTEIHIDHTGKMNRQRDVNRNLPDLTELWNIVFIQYNRNIDGSINLLPKCHIDTGMGLERLTAILQGKKSNYDTDIFSNLFECIKKNCPGLPDYSGTFSNNQNDIDTGYRILADHSRMITACLADGMIPEQNQKLRRILRKAMLVSETVFKKDKGLLCELTKTVSQNLGDIFPEMHTNLAQVQQIISYEEDVYKSIRSTATKEWQKILQKEPKLNNLNILEMPGLVTAYNELISVNNKTILPEIAFKMYDTYGLDETTLTLLSNALNLNFDAQDLKKQLELAKNRTKQSYLSADHLQTILQYLTANINKTDDSFKYNYRFNKNTYEFNDIDVKILSIICNNKPVDELQGSAECYLVLNRTNLYSEAGGQISDTGELKFANKLFKVTETQNIGGYILHKGTLSNPKDSLTKGETGTISIDTNNRLKLMINHTATHLLNAALKKVSKGVTCQKSSKVTPELLTFDVGIYSKKLSMDDIENIEELIRKIIKKSVPVQVKEINSQQLLSLNNVTLVPGEIYPDIGIRLIEIESDDYLSREPCCGTHILNTSHIKDVCVVNLKSLGRSTSSLSLVSGDRAISARKNGERILKEVLKLEKSFNNPSETDITDKTINKLRQKLNYNLEDDSILPVTVKAKCAKILNEISKQLKDSERDSLKHFVDLEMASVLEINSNKSKSNQPYIVHFLGCSSILDNVPLSRATKICSEVPVIVISYSDEIAKARCCVPKSLASEKFNADLWLNESVSKVFKSINSVPKGQDSKLVSNMKAKRINKHEWESSLDEACKSAKRFADENL